MKVLLYIAGGFAVSTIAALVITQGDAPAGHPAMMLGLVVVVGIPTVGAFWMMYMSVRDEKNPLPLILLAMIPFTFLWYYFDRVRPRELARGRGTS